MILFVCVLFAIFLCSCATTYYQVHRASLTDKMITDRSNLTENINIITGKSDVETGI